MKTTSLPIENLNEAPWNANEMDETMCNYLKESINKYGLVQPLVVRPISESEYEVLSGNQRLKIIKELGYVQVPCVTVNLNDHDAMLLAQALNAIHGSDDLYRKGNMLRNILSAVPQDRVLSLLPETVDSLKSLSTIGQQDLAAHLQAWQQAQAARLRHMQLQFTRQQLELVEEAIAKVTVEITSMPNDNPNRRGNAIYQLCRFYLEKNKERNQT